MKRHLCLALVLVACGDAARPIPPAQPQPLAHAGLPADPLGARPGFGEPAPYVPPTPVAYKHGPMTVWLLERHGLPLVSMHLVVPAGAAHDPEGKSGLAHATANMLDEGAGARGALELSRDVDRLGASLVTGANADYAFVRLTALKKNLAPAAAILGDVVQRPRLEAVEWKRVHDLWENQLRARQSDPESVSTVVVKRKAYPPGHPYAHPTEGLVSTAPKVSLDDVKKFYAAEWRADLATCVVVGDITRAELDGLLDQVFGGWKAPALPPRTALPAPAFVTPRPGPRRVVVVDRPDAPQAVVALVRPGFAAADPERPIASRANTALGGSFTSRLNQDLREEKNWTYGAESAFSLTRSRGLFLSAAAVVTEHTGEAVSAMIADIEKFTKEGMTDEEVDRTKKLAHADLVAAFETVEGTATRLARSAGLGLGPGFDASSALVEEKADKAALAKVSATTFDLATAILVIVGPRAKIEPQIKAALGAAVTFEASGPEGQ